MGPSIWRRIIGAVLIGMRFLGRNIAAVLIVTSLLVPLLFSLLMQPRDTIVEAIENVGTKVSEFEIQIDGRPDE